jgi:hypothetical protein
MKEVPSILKTLAIPLVLGSSLDCSLLRSTSLFREKTEQALKGTSACSGKNIALNKLVAQKKLKEKNPGDTRPILVTVDGNCAYAYFDESVAVPAVAPAATTPPAPAEPPTPAVEEPPKPQPTETTQSANPTSRPKGKMGRSGGKKK